MKTIRTAPSIPALLTISTTNLSAARRRLLEWILTNEAQRKAAGLGQRSPLKP